MSEEKKELLKAYSYIYDIETFLKDILAQRISTQHLLHDVTYWEVVNFAEQYNVLNFSPFEYKLLRKTISIRNKICHMKPLSSEDITCLKKTHQLISSQIIKKGSKSTRQYVAYN